MRKVLYVAAGLLVLLIGGALAIPSFLDWNAYKPQIAAAVKDATGRELRIAGDIRIAILPTPALSVERASLENVAGADNREMVNFQELQVRLDIGALLKGRVAVRSVRLIRPIIALETTEDGRASWDITPPGKPSASGSAPAPSGTEVTAGGTSVDVSLDNLHIEDGILSYRDARTGTYEKIEDLSADISADSLSGPFRAEGRATARGLPLRFSAAAGRLDDGSPLPVRLTLGLEGTEGELRFAGNLSDPSPEGELSGRLEATAKDLAALAGRAAQVDLPPALAREFALEGEVTAGAEAAGINNLSVRIGDTSLAGAVHMLFTPRPSIDVILTAGRIDLDALLRSAGGGKPPDGKTAPPGTPAADGKTPPAGPSTASSGFTLPADLSASIDVTVEAVTWRGGVIRDAALRAELADGVLAVKRAAAQMPGSSDFSISGAVRAVDGQPKFEGEVAATADNLRSMLEWLGADPAALPADRLRSFSYTSRVSATPTLAEVTDIAMQIDTSRITGGLVAELRERPGIGLRLAVDKLNLDAYLPRPGTSQPAGKPQGAAATPDSGGKPEATPGPQVPSGALDALDAFDANIDLSAGQVSFNGETLRTARLDFTVLNGEITVREASVADFAGAGASVAGTIGGLRSAPKAAMDFAVEVRDAARFFRFLGTPPPVPVARLGKLGGEGHIDATLLDISTKSSLRAMGGEVSIDGKVAGFLGTPKIDLGVRLSHPEMAKLAQSLAPDYRPAAASLGPVELDLRLAGGPDDLRASDLEGKLGPVNVEGSVAYARPKGRATVTADLRTSEVLVDLFLPRETARNGRSSGGASSRSGGGRASGRGGNATGQRWSTEPIVLPLPPDLDMDAKLEMAALTRGDMQLESPRLHAVLKDGRLTVDRFTARLFGGAISSSGVIEPKGRTAAVSLDVSADKIDSRKAGRALTGHDRVDGPLSINGRFTTQGNSEATLVSALNGKATVSGRMQVLLTRQERESIGAANVGGALLSNFLGSKVRELRQFAPLTQLLVALDQAFGRNPATLSGDIGITDGIARTDNLTLAGTGNQAVTKATLDLPRWDLASRTELIDDPKQEPLITFEANGPPDDPSRTRIGGRLLKGGASSTRDKATQKLQELLPGVLGGGQSGTQQQDQPQQQQKPSPRSILEGVLKNMQR